MTSKSASKTVVIPQPRTGFSDPEDPTSLPACPTWATCPGGRGHEHEDPCDRVHWGPQRYVAVSTEQKVLSVFAGQWMYAAEPYVQITLREPMNEADLFKLTLGEARTLQAVLREVTDEINEAAE